MPGRARRGGGASLSPVIRDIGLILMAIAAALFLRLCVASPFHVPSGSMMPALMPGDYVLAARWPVRLAHRLPVRGEIVVFKSGDRTFVKRVIGLPGDRVALVDGYVRLNGNKLPRWRVADLLMPPGPAACAASAAPCHIRRFREMLPSGRTIDTLAADTGAAANYPETRVPAGHLFVLGDNRDRSLDSRVQAGAAGGPGFVPSKAVVAWAQMVIFSSDGARWNRPGLWRRQIRWERIGLLL